MSDPTGDDRPNEGARRILIVDDALMFRELETLFLGRSGHVYTACDGHEALDTARRIVPDVIVTDMSMPGMDGDELCTRVKNDPDLRRIPVVVVTGGALPEEHERAVRAGADDVLEKPVSRVTLIRAVNHFLRLAFRGLERVPLETDVRLSEPSGASTWGWARNVSRGGIYVEHERPFEPDTELEIEFQMPETRQCVAPTARVVWRRLASPTERPGMGLQFLKLDREQAQLLEDYVYELAEPEEGPPGDPVAA